MYQLIYKDSSTKTGYNNNLYLNNLKVKKIY